MAYIRPPALNDQQNFDNAACAFNKRAYGHELSAELKFEDKGDGRMHLELYECNNPMSINHQLLKNGWARLITRLPNTDYCNELRNLEDEAKKNKLNIWN